MEQGAEEKHFRELHGEKRVIFFSFREQLKTPPPPPGVSQIGAAYSSCELEAGNKTI